MAVEYTEEILTALDAMVAANLDRWNLSPQTSVERLNVSENATYALRDPAGCNRVLRVHRLGYSSPEEIRSELEWINALRHGGVIETAAPLPGTDGEYVQRLASRSGGAPRFAVAFERLPGREPDARDAVRWFERLGEVTARMHAQSKAWTFPPSFCRKRWNVDAMVGPRGFWGPWRAGMGLDAAGARTLEYAIAAIRGRLENFGQGPEVFGLIHADLRLANLLVDGERLCIIDFDDCGFGWFLYDFATALSFIEHEPVVPDLFSAWAAGYRRVGALSPAEVAEIPTFIVLRRILLTAWLASHAELPFARDLGVGYTVGTIRLAEEWLRGEFLSRDIGA